MEKYAGTKSILVVDDDESILRLSKLMLEWMGYDVTAVPGGDEALELFRYDPTRYDLVITDLIMPRMMGDALAQRILEIRPDMPVVFCSGSCEPGTDAEARAMGIRGFICKPFDREALAKVVRAVLDDVEPRDCLKAAGLR